MKVLDARIDWQEGFSSNPTLQLLVDRVPEMCEMTFDSMSSPNGCQLHFAELNGYVMFFCEDPRDHRGYGGNTFKINCRPQGIRVLVGPWSSRAGAMNCAGFTPSCDVVLTTDSEEWKHDRSLGTGHITVELAMQAIREFLPAVTAEIDAHDELVLVFRRVDNPCPICKGAKQYKWGGPKLIVCRHCDGTGHEPAPIPKTVKGVE